MNEYKLTRIDATKYLIEDGKGGLYGIEKLYRDSKWGVWSDGRLMNSFDTLEVALNIVFNMLLIEKSIVG